MIYSDAENQRWWETLTRQDRHEILETISGNAKSPSVIQWLATLCMKLQANLPPTSIDLVKLRQWAK